jgi:hypothetical protein
VPRRTRPSRFGWEIDRCPTGSRKSGNIAKTPCMHASSGRLGGVFSRCRLISLWMGFGCEFVFETMAQQDWAIARLQHLMAFQILLCHGRYQRKEPLSLYDRIPLRASITSEPSELCWLILAPPESYEARFQLASGWVDLYAVFGATEEEAALARKQSGDKLVEMLKQYGAFPVTNPNRRSLVASERR